MQTTSMQPTRLAADRAKLLAIISKRGCVDWTRDTDRTLHTSVQYVGGDFALHAAMRQRPKALGTLPTPDRMCTIEVVTKSQSNN